MQHDDVQAHGVERATTTDTGSERAVQKDNWLSVLNKPYDDPVKQQGLELKLYEQLRSLPRARRDLLPHRLQVFFAETMVALGKAAIEAREAKHINVMLRTPLTVDRVLHATFGTPPFRTYTRRAFFPKEGFAETSRVLDQSRQATYRHIYMIEAILEHLPEVNGKIDDGIIARSLWQEACIRLRIPIDKFWARDQKNAGTIEQAKYVLRAFEEDRLRRMSKEALLKEESRLVLAGMALRERLALVRTLTPNEG